MCVGAPAGAFSEPKIATLCSFGTDNSSFCVLNTDFEISSIWRLWQDTLAGDSGWMRLLLAAPGRWLGCWRHPEGPGCKKWCHSQPKSTFHVKSIKKSSVFEGDMDFDRFFTAT